VPRNRGPVATLIAGVSLAGMAPAMTVEDGTDTAVFATYLAHFLLPALSPGMVIVVRRWVVERTLTWISKHRRCVRDYETQPGHAEAMVYLAMIMTMSRRLAR
jgi:hypothetical protein